jgi:prepilin-type N-terminal cleavage/methylation domain-containing protein
MSISAFRQQNNIFRNCRGFSLIEISIVLVNIGNLAGIAAPAVGRILDCLRFRQQVSKFSAVLRYARLIAVSRGEIVTLALPEEGDCVFVLSGPVEETRECGLGEDDVLTMDPGEIYFFPEGIATPALLTFEKGERIKRIRLDLLTARPVSE